MSPILSGSRTFSGNFWGVEEINSRMESIMVESFNSVMDLAEAEKVGTREAAMLMAVQRVTEAITVRGVYP